MQSKLALPTLRLCSATMAVLLGGLLAFASCGGVEDPDSISVVVHMPAVPSDATQLSVLASLDGRAAMQPLAITESAKFSRFGVRLAKDKSGTLALTIDVTDANACKLGTATATTPIGPPLQADISATLTLLGTRQCPAPPQPMTCSPSLFCWSNPLPQGNTVRGLFALGGSDIWAVGDAGTALHYNGTAWSPVASGVADNLLGVWGSSASDVYAVGENGRIVHWNGTAFATQNSGIGTTLRGIWGSSSGDVYAVGDGGSIIHSGGGGAWGGPVTVAGSTETLNAIAGTGPNNVYVVGNNGTVGFYSGTWSKQTVMAPANTTSLFGVAIVGTTGFAVGAGGTILMLSGTTWSTTTSPTAQQLNAIYGRSATDFWAVGAGGARVRYTGSWVDASGADSTMTNLFAVNGSVSSVLAGGDAGALLSTTGTSWSTISSGSINEIRSMYGFSPKDIWAVGAKGMIMHYNGTVWTTSNSGTTENLNSIWGSSAKDIWAVGDAKTITRYDGNTWTPKTITDPVLVDLKGVWGSGSDDVWVVGTCMPGMENDILHFTGGGNPSALVLMAGSGNAPPLYSVWGSSSQNILIGGDHVVVSVGFNLGQLTAGTTTVGAAIRGLWGSRSNDVWAVGDGGLISHFNGTGWASASSGSAANLTSVWGSSDKDVWAVGTLGNVLRYDGTSWSNPTNVTKNTLNTVFGFNSADVWTAGAGGTILHTLK